MSEYQSVSNRILLVDHPEDEECTDFTLFGGSCWITVGSFSVRVWDTGEGVSVEVTPKGKEDGDILAELYATEDMLPDEEEE